MARRIRAREVLRQRAACARRVRSCCVRQPDLEDLWRESWERPGGERKLVRKYGAFGLLVVDEWLLDRPDTEFRSMLLELMEPRCGTTVFCTSSRRRTGARGSAAGCMPTTSWTGPCTTRPGSTWARPTRGSAADRPTAIKSTGNSAGPGAQARYRPPFHDIRQRSSEQMLTAVCRPCPWRPRPRCARSSSRS